ncbi:MAG: DoxX family protein [Pseudomonadota bacterium]
MDFLVNLLIALPARIAAHFSWAGPLYARLVVGYVFMWTGWQKLNNLPVMIQNFTEWGIPFPALLTPFASGVEFFGGIALILGLFTRIFAAQLAFVMIVAVKVAKFGDWMKSYSAGESSLDILLGFEEFTYMAVFFWLAVAGPGKVSLDYLLLRSSGRNESGK